MDEDETTKMPAATRLECGLPNCTLGQGSEAGGRYKTPPHLSKIEETQRDMEQHLQVHSLLKNEKQDEENKHRPKLEAISRPTLKEGSSEGTFQFFLYEWGQYKESIKMSDKEKVKQLAHCVNSDIRRKLFESSMGREESEQNLLDHLKRLCVKTQNRLINIVEFGEIVQGQDELIAVYLARLKGAAANCKFRIKCSKSDCDQVNDYSEEMISYQIVRGLADTSIQEEVLSKEASTPNMNLSDIVSLVEAKEQGKRSQNLLNSGVISSIRSDVISKQFRAKPNEGRDRQAKKCFNCGLYEHGINKFEKQKFCKAFKHVCGVCRKIGHFESECRKKKSGNNAVELEEETVIEEIGSFGEIFALENLEIKSNLLLDRNIGKGGMRCLNHHAWDAFYGWRPKRGEDHPRIPIQIEVENISYKKLNLPYPRKAVRAETVGVADTGAMMVIINVGTMRMLGVEEEELIPMSLNITAANSSKVKLLGGILVTIEAIGEDGKARSSRQLVYVAEGCAGVYLSQRVCKDLGLIPETFPRIGEFGKVKCARRRSSSTPPYALNNNNARDMETPIMYPPAAVVAEMSEFYEIKTNECCNCVTREFPPTPPTKMPFSPIEENVPKLKKWIEEYYEASTFNKCEHSPLPMMRGSPPLKLHIDPNAKAVAAHKYSPVPVHFEEVVKQELDRDIKMGVLEKVPVGTPSEWCSRMVVVAKPNGKPRRTVDLKQLNRAAKRQTHPTETPFHQAMSIPRGTYKTVTDAWNGYHSIPLEESDRPYTTFITKWGRYRYRVAPQGFRASGDGYTARFDEITKDVTNCKRCVDDSLLFENTIEENFFKTCEYIHLLGSHGIILNKEKFQFCQKEVDYVGFRITENGVKPSEETLRAIKEFPRPTNISGIRSFFGLIEQVSFAFSKTDVMAPFRHLLSPKTLFSWNDSLEEAFEKGKAEVLKKVMEGIHTFDLNRRTCLQVDWSKEGIGFLLLQKYCACIENSPRCCSKGWRLCYVNSRFLSGAESRYKPIEGEMLAIVWGLKKTRHWVSGCPNLVVATDHKPLLGVFEKDIGDIENPRLRALMEKTLQFYFEIIHLPGVINSGADATSRNPVGDAEHGEVAAIQLTGKAFLEHSYSELSGDDIRESERLENRVAELATIMELPNKYQVNSTHTQAELIDWNEVRVGTKQCEELNCVMESIIRGRTEYSKLGTYEQVAPELVVENGVVMYKDCVVIHHGGLV